MAKEKTEKLDLPSGSFWTQSSKSQNSLHLWFGSLKKTAKRPPPTICDLSKKPLASDKKYMEMQCSWQLKGRHQKNNNFLRFRNALHETWDDWKVSCKFQQLEEKKWN